MPPDDPLEPIDAIALRKVEAFVREVEIAVERGDIDASEDTLTEIRDLLQTMTTQLRGRPRQGVVWAVMRVIAQLLIGAGGNAAFELAKQAAKVFG